MRCAKCGGKVGSIPMKNINGVKGYCYFCNSCHNSFWKSLDGSIVDSRDVQILGADMSKAETKACDYKISINLVSFDMSNAEPKACDYEISIDLVSFGVDTATKVGKKIANDIADYLGNAGYNVSISRHENNEDK